MINLLIGRNPLTSIAGYVVAVLTAIQHSAASGAHGWQSFLLPVAIALFGRLAADERQNHNPPPKPDFPIPADPTDSLNSIPPSVPDDPGKEHTEQAFPPYEEAPQSRSFRSREIKPIAT